ncbi:MAG: hypothetical protein AABZ78_07760 [Chloroflexota bacterium]
MFLDRLSEFISKRRGLPTMIAIVFVAVNLIFQFIPGLEWFARTNILLHVGVIIGLLGILLSAALGG